MQIRTSSSFDQPAVRLNTANPADPFVTVDHGRSAVIAETVAECDAMIAAWTEAKRLLIDALIREEGEELGREIAADEGLDDRVTNYLACGDQLDDAAQIDPGTEITCPRHGTTTVITAEEYARGGES